MELTSNTLQDGGAEITKTYHPTSLRLTTGEDATLEEVVLRVQGVISSLALPPILKAGPA